MVANSGYDAFISYSHQQSRLYLCGMCDQPVQSYVSPRPCSGRGLAKLMAMCHHCRMTGGGTP